MPLKMFQLDRNLLRAYAFVFYCIIFWVHLFCIPTFVIQKSKGEKNLKKNQAYNEPKSEARPVGLAMRPCGDVARTPHLAPCQGLRKFPENQGPQEPGSSAWSINFA